MPLDNTIRRITTKELTLFFASPIGYLFLACFAAVTLFIFFWGETFFARNIADVRPLFEWMPILLIFLTSALTMRMWSEERRSGTLEHVLTQPQGIWRFVAGKFLACLALLAIALVVTLPLPITVAMIGDLDWGPVWSGYLATLLLGAAYLSIGLFVSARSDNQIVSLISAVAVCGLFYLIGSPAITDFFGNQAGEWLRALGTGSRFDAITRGVIDVRDFVYYLSIIAIFLSLNTFSLEKERWATIGDTGHHRSWKVGTALLAANAIAVNLWLGQINVLRVDTTEGNLYSISDATRNYLSHLQEPLLIRGYFSSKTHPLLAPLVPQMRDLIREYQVAGNGRVRVEFVDPMTDPELEKEANNKYGIEPVPFQVADRYQSSLVNSYFNVLVKYGEDFQVLGFRDLIEVKSQGDGNLDVQLRNPEYDITRAVKKVLLAYQSGGNVFDTVKGDLSFTAYVSADDKLPKQLAGFKKAVKNVVDDYSSKSGGRLKSQFIDPQANGGQVAQQIANDYGFKPMVAGLFDSNQFYFYMTLSKGDQIVQIPLGDMTGDDFKLAMDAGIKRFANGFTKTVALVTPESDPQMARFGMGGPQFTQLEKVLGADYNIKHDDLKDGSVNSEADLLILAAPNELDKKQLFAVDQFLMRGGTVIAATSPYSANMTRNSLAVKQRNSGLEKWLDHNGLKLQHKLVMDPQNSAFPIPVTRRVGALSFQEMRMIDYPYFADLRSNGLNQNNPVTSNLNQLTMAWASPITIEKDINAKRKITELLYSSDRAWQSTSLDVMPKIDRNGRSLFQPEGDQGKQLLGAISQGQFTSYFAGKKSPLLESASDDKQSKSEKDKTKDDNNSVIGSVIEHSPESARIILLASNEFLNDKVMRLIGASNGSQYLGGLQLMSNAVDWSLEDQGLLSIRSRGHFNRTLPPMDHDNQVIWESANYILAVVMLLALAMWQAHRRRQRARYYTETLAV
ncbi:MAG: Gldg family protein [Gammaproteobacteria bacterium]|jgi:ABC-2 type transport system permease protein